MKPEVCMPYRLFFKFLVFAFILKIGINQTSAQDVELGIEYVKAGEYEKAKSIFQKLAKNKDIAGSIHKPYLQTLYKLKEMDEAEKFLKKQIKWSDGNPFYLIDYAHLLEEQKKKEEADKLYNQILEKCKVTDELTLKMVNEFSAYQQYEWAINLLEKNRLYFKDNNKFPLQVGRLYKLAAKPQEMLEEYLNFGRDIENREILQGMLQDELRDENDQALLEKVLYAKVQKFPEDPYYSEMLIWHLTQKKEFFKAFVQARALDKRYKREGAQVADLGFLAYQNKDFSSAGKVFEYLIKEYPKQQNYPLWRRVLINSKEEVIKNTYPVNQSDIRILIQEYTKLLNELGINQRTLEALRSKGLLYGFYLNEKDTAIAVLESAIKLSTGNREFVDKCKLDLGDIYVLKSEPWEATLLYSQVEKSEKDSPMGYEAKLRNAKLSYYKGDFELAKDILDILKQATTREIANDAMNLSLLIQDNSGIDSTDQALKDYANVELMLFQHRNEAAMAEMKNLIIKHKGHPLEDEYMYLLATTYLKEGRVDEAIEQLEKIVDKFPTDILGDDSLYILAKIYQEKKNQPSKAMKLFQELLTKYPGSIYGAEARKRFRNLRGDTIN